MDIGSKNSWPSCSLSNFAPHPFEIDGVQCNSMEGFLQSLKFANPDMQAHVCTLVGIKAKMKGKHKNWYTTQTLYWRGIPMKRDSEAYQILLNRAYNQLNQNGGFRSALLATGKAVFTHSIGKNDETHTVLTVKQFCSRLMHLRDVGDLPETPKKDPGPGKPKML